MGWRLITEDAFFKLPAGQAVLLQDIARKMKATILWTDLGYHRLIWTHILYTNLFILNDRLFVIIKKIPVLPLTCIYLALLVCIVNPCYFHVIEFERIICIDLLNYMNFYSNDIFYFIIDCTCVSKSVFVENHATFAYIENVSSVQPHWEPVGDISSKKANVSVMLQGVFK